jgi:hypothetical protein
MRLFLRRAAHISANRYANGYANGCDIDTDGDMEWKSSLYI